MNIRSVIRYVYKGAKYAWIVLKSKVYTTLFRIKLWLNGVEFMTGVRAFNAIPSLQISRRSGKVMLGKNVLFNNYLGNSWNRKCKLWVCKGASLTIGDNSGMNGALVYCAESITIGNNVIIGGSTSIYDTDFHNLDYLKRRNPKTNLQAITKPIVIEDDVFIGANCMIGKGVTIGTGSIIAAGSVVVKSTPPHVIAGGNPCKVIKTINSEQTDINNNSDL